MGFLKRLKGGKTKKSGGGGKTSGGGSGGNSSDRAHAPRPESARGRKPSGAATGKGGGGSRPADAISPRGGKAAASASPTGRAVSGRGGTGSNGRPPQASYQPNDRPVVDQTPPNLRLLPNLIRDLDSSADVSGDVPARALRMLFSLSENSVAHQENRTRMVRESDGRLVPVLLNFLRRCDRSSSEQYLALLVLNNISIPSDNKRLIAIDYGGAHMLSRLLCIDPSCHLMAIVLVNLSFADAELRRELVAPSSSVQLVDALSYVLLVSTLSPSEHEARASLLTVEEERDQWLTLSPRKLLATAMAEDRRHRPALTDLDYNGPGAGRGRSAFDASNQMHPETSRWCLCALKNLTRPSKDPLAAHALIDTGIVPIILKVATVGDGGVPPDNSVGDDDLTSEPLVAETCGAPCGWDEPKEAVENVAPALHLENNPSKWDSNSLQDAALFTLLNMSSMPAARPYLRELDAVHTLSLITSHVSWRVKYAATTDEEKQLGFQCLKARMALGFLLGSEGHFGQSRGQRGRSEASVDESAILISEAEVQLLVELLVNTLHQRAKEGAGGYSAATFSVKGVLFAIRCLLTNYANECYIFSKSGLQINALLLKALAQHAVQRVTTIDAEAAEHACFSLYLLSNLGFKNSFLPASFNRSNEVEKVLTSYLHTENVTPAGRHAAGQLLLRLRYLVFDGSIGDDFDYSLSPDLQRDMELIIVEKRTPGAKPRDDIFNRPILRSRAPKKGTDKASWDNKSSVSAFPSALVAAQQFSFGSTKVRHLGAIDDILIANNIANSANGEKTESYNYWWIWQNEANGQGGGNDAPSGKASSGVRGLLARATSSGDDQPLSIFGFTCCAADTV